MRTAFFAAVPVAAIALGVVSPRTAGEAAPQTVQEASPSSARNIPNV